jgi:hypothetical protein
MVPSFGYIDVAASDCVWSIVSGGSLENDTFCYAIAPARIWMASGAMLPNKRQRKEIDQAGWQVGRQSQDVPLVEALHSLRNCFQ